MTTSDSTSSGDARPSGIIGSVAKALELLQLFAGGRAVQVNQASRTLKISRSTVHRLLTTLVAYGYVEQDQTTRAYLPGPALTGIGLAAVQGNALSSAARGALVALAEATGDTVHLMELRGDHILCLDSIESQKPLRTPSRIGWNLPAHSTAGGKAVLAGLTDEAVEEIFPGPMIYGQTRSSPVRRIDLLADLELVRARGYATNFGESEPSLGAVAVVLKDHQNNTRAALSVTVPRARADDDWARVTAGVATDIVDGYRLSL